jgi:hypothetical protein
MTQSGHFGQQSSLRVIPLSDFDHTVVAQSFETRWGNFFRQERMLLVRRLHNDED